ncbi:glycine-rich domain-containing protein [Sorangium sp. So ce854]|uniref:glycine-rich domain-containing protein n=1 Tax=Sorangium sp. So ce854 TaxID=3133322 RepID=UPI003F6213E5
MKRDRPRVTEAALKALLGDALFSGVVRHFAQTTGEEPAHVERQVVECLRYLYLISRYPEPLAGLFLPVEQAIDEIWHYLILQTREYRELCEERLPGRFFIHHRSLPYEDYQATQQPGREQALEEALRWLPLYSEEFGPFDEGALPHWTMVRFLHQHLGLSLDAIAALGADDEPARPDAERVR